jgi:hypothetical protein
MDSEKVQAIIGQIGEDSVDEFLLSLGSLHSNLNRAIEMAALMSAADEDHEIEEEDEYEDPEEELPGADWISGIGDDSEYDDDPEFSPIEEESEDSGGLSVKDLTESLANNFAEGGIHEVAEELSRIIAGFSLDLDSISPYEDQVHIFIVEYGFVNFVKNDFSDISTSFGSPTDPSDLAPEPADTTDSPTSVPTIGGVPIHRPEDDILKKNVKTRDDISVIHNLYLNMNLEQGFFETDDSEGSYANRLIKAQEENEDVNALNFHPIFEGLGDNAVSFDVDNSSSPPVLVFSVEKMQAIIQAIVSELSALNNAVKISKSKLAGESFERFYERLRAFETQRLSFSGALDDIAAAIKKRDGYALSLVYNLKSQGVDVSNFRDSYKISNVIRDESSQLFRLFYDLAIGLVFVDIESEAYQYKLSKKLRETYDEWKNIYAKDLEHQLSSKIKKFFNSNDSNGWQRGSLSSYLAGSIKRQMLQEGAYKKAFAVVTTSQNIADCAVCGVTIYTRKRQDTPGVEGRPSRIDLKEYAEYEDNRYSLFRSRDRSLITIDDLNAAADGSGKFEPPPTLAAQGEVSMSWGEIESLVHSGSKSKHIEGVQRRSWALRLMGAAPIPTRKKEISNFKYKCPYSNIADRSPDLNEVSETKARFQCGLSIDATPLLQPGAGFVDPSNLQSTSSSSSGEDPEQVLEAELEQAVQMGNITEEQKDGFIEELRKRRGGGWKFSNKYFNCPARIVIPEEDRNPDAFKKKYKEYMRNYSYIATPIAGPISEDKISEGHIVPPVNADGSYSNVEDGTLSYLVCGTQTSLSSFSRNPEEEGSLPNLIKDLALKAEQDDQYSKFFMVNLIETLIYLGVDVDDLLPFVSNIERPTEAVLELEKSGRLKALSGILATAMASPVNLGAQVGEWAGESGVETSVTRMDILKDIKLVCPHRHRFTINDSVMFGRTHTGINLRNKRRSVYTWKEIIDSGLLFAEGYDNFQSTLKLRSKNGSSYIVTSEDWASLGEEGKRLSYEEWVDRVDKVNKVSFSDHYGEGSYSFGAVPKNYLWGSEEGYRLSSARQREVRDPETIRVINDNRSSSLDPGSKKDSEGKLRGVDSETKAAKQKFDNQNSGVSSLFDRAKKDLVSEGAVGIKRITLPLGRMLKSFVINIQDWLDMSATLDVKGALVGSPVLLEESDEHLMLDSARSMIEVIVRVVEEENEEDSVLSAELGTLIDAALQNFKERYFKILEGLDLRMIGVWGGAFDIVSDERIVSNVVHSVVRAATDQLGPEESRYYELTLFEGNVLALDHVTSLSYGGKNISNMLDDFRNTFIPDLSKEQQGRILSGTNPGLMIPKMKGKEFMGRVLQASSAMYLSDAISRIYNFYMRDPNSKEYIGYDIGFDLSDADKVINLDRDALNSLTSGMSETEIRSLSMSEDRINVFYEMHFDNIVGCITSLQDEMFRLRTACSSQLYMNKAIEYIQNEFNEVLDNTTALESDVERARLIVDNVMSNPPITTISLNSEGKYARHFGSSDIAPADPNSLVPLFGAYLVEYKGREDYYPIFALTGRGIVYHDFNINIPEPANIKDIYVLANKNIPMSIELEDLYDRLPEAYKQNGWKIFQVSTEHYKMADKKTNTGIKSGISLIYHPGTSAVLDGDDLMGYQNSDLGYDSQAGMHIGSLAIRSGTDNLFPPSPVNGISNVGVPIPLDYENADSKKNRIFPIIGARIPVSLPTSTAGETIELELSDFLLRDPPDAAFYLLREIDMTYEKMKHDLALASGEPERDAVIARYKEIISSLHSTYRGLPLYVANSKSGTKTEKRRVGTLDASSVSDKFSPRVSAYLPMVDWITMHRMISATNPQFGPEFGGHQLWSEEDGSEVANETMEAVEQFLINVHGLDKLARQIGSELGGRYIDPTDLLDPVNRLFRNGSISPKECERLFGYRIGNNEDQTGYTSEDGFPWMGVSSEARTRAANFAGGKMFDRFGSWVKGVNSYYSVGLNNEVDEDTMEPHSYIKMLNVIFAPDKKKKRLEEARDPDTDVILTADDLYAFEAFEGIPNSQRYYPVPDDPKQHAKFIKNLKKTKHIGAQKYAEALSEYLINHMLNELAHDLGGMERRSFYKFDIIKYSKNLKKHIYRSGIIQSTRLQALWNKLTN